MKRLRIHIDLALPGEVLERIRSKAHSHQLLFPPAPLTSVLAKPPLDPEFATADVAFGQPDIRAIESAPALRWIHVSSSGFTRYDTPGFRSHAVTRGLRITNSAKVYDEACATHLLSFMLAEARRIPHGLETRAACGSDPWLAVRSRSRILRGDRVLILGYGAIGRVFVRFLKPLGVHISGFRRKPVGDENIPMVTESGLSDALASADHVVNILPENIGTRGFFNADRFRQIRKGAAFYNIGRGATVDQPSLAAALHDGQIGAAWLDVTDPEPLPDEHPLWKAPNCYITPHTGGGQINEVSALAEHFLENLDRYERGVPLADRVI